VNEAEILPAQWLNQINVRDLGGISMKSKLLIAVLAVAVIASTGVVTSHVAAQGDDEKAQLGVYLSEGDNNKVIITSIIPGTAADDAGLKRNDVVLAVNGQAVNSSKELVKIIQDKKPGDEITIRLERKGMEQTLTVKLKKAKADIFSIYEGKKDYVFTPGVKIAAYNSTFGAKAYLGIFHSDLTKALGEYFGVEGGHGVLITDVVEDSPAAKAGLKAGDVIVAVNGKKVEDFSELEEALYLKKDEEESETEENEETTLPLNLTIMRDKSERNLQVDAEVKKGNYFFRSYGKGYKDALKHFELQSGKLKDHAAWVEAPGHKELIIMGEHLKNKGLKVQPRLHLDEDKIHILEGKAHQLLDLDLDLPSSHFMSLKIDDEDNVEINFNGKKFDSIDALKSYIESDEFKAKQKEKKEKLQKKIKRIQSIAKSKSEKI
jgi:hypothetical protein